jgi:hypothetical protein
MVELVLVSLAVIVGAGLAAVAAYLVLGLVLRSIASAVRRARLAGRS